MSRPARQDRDEVLAMLALLGQTGVARGPRPTQFELIALSRGTLPASRHAEVESHVAHDPHVFREFLAVCSVPVRNASVPRRAWPAFSRGSLVAFAACVLATIGIVLVMNAQQRATPEQPTRFVHEAASRSHSAVTPDWRRSAFRYGYENPNLLGRWMSSSENAFSAVCSGGDCGNEIDALTEFGAVLARLDGACRSERNTVDALPDASAEIRRLQDVRSQLSDSPWRRQVDRLLLALGQPARKACADIDRIGRSVNTPR